MLPSTKRKRGLAQLTQQIAQLSAGSSDGGTHTSYGCQGADPESVKQRLENTWCVVCQGSRGKGKAKKVKGSKSPCHSFVQLKPLQEICRMFWSQTDDTRAHLIRTLYDQAREETQGQLQIGQKARVDWGICGVKVCFKVFASLLRVGPNWIHDSIRGVPDLRRSSLAGRLLASSREKPQSHQIDCFFMELYQSAAEPMPHDPSCGGPSPIVSGLGADVTYNDEPWLMAGQSLTTDGFNNEANVMSVSDWCSDKPSIELYTAMTVACSACVVGMPHRYLPPGRPSDLYWNYVAARGVQESKSPWVQSMGPPASLSTFWRGWLRWKEFLTFRKTSQHSKCTTCWKYQQVLHNQASSWQEKINNAVLLKQHYADQYCDRAIYWSLRWFSGLKQSILVIIMDGLDKTKFAFPRFQESRMPKSMDNTQRPKMILTAAIAHGWITCLYLQSEIENHGSDQFCELLTRTIDKVMALVQRSRSREAPCHLVLQADNPTGQAKNTYVMTYLAYLTARYKFATVTINFLMVGHTHEDIDQLFAVVVALILRKQHFETAEEMLDYVAVNLKERCRLKGEEFSAEVVTAIRDFATWLAPLGICFDQAFGTRNGIEAPHSFFFKKRCDLNAVEKEWLTRQESRGQGSTSASRNPSDVFCMVKNYMRDTDLQQAPEQCLDHSTLRVVRTAGPPEVVQKGALSAAAITSYLKLADFCDRELGLKRASQALRDLVHVRQYHIPRAGWLEEPGQHAREMPQPEGNPYYNHLPKPSWKLRVSQAAWE